MNNAALIIIYNHNFEKNIDKTESLYKKQFSTIIHLIPFYSGKRKNVIRVHGNSITFQEYIAQATYHLEPLDVEHYIFIADDLLLNPNINETNYKFYFQINEEKCYIPRLGSIPESKNYWNNYRSAVNFSFSKYKIEVPAHELPNLNDINKRFSKLNIKNTRLSLKNLYKKKDILLFIKDLLKHRLDIKSLMHTKYPLVRSYSDIFIINKKSYKQFSKFCSLFGSLDLFVELAIPTSIVYANENLSKDSDLSYSGLVFWNNQDLLNFRGSYGDISNLIDNYPEKTLYIHPIKLSQWI